MKTVRIYDGNGVDSKCSFDTRVALSSIYGGTEYVSAAQIKNNEWMQYTSMLVFPGGVASPYNEDLGDEGMESIRTFVDQGGVFLGICAGAYFSAKESEFGGIYGLPCINKSHLGLYDGKVIGPVYNNFAAKSRIEVLCSDNVKREGFSYGGGYFQDSNLVHSTTVLASYPITSHAAFVKVGYGNGVAFSSFVHFEYSDVWPDWKKWLKDEIKLDERAKSSGL